MALLLPGQGSQYDRMAAGLYRHEPSFTAAIDEVFAAFGAEGEALRQDWLGVTPTVSIDHVTRAQPLLFAVDYALGRMVMNWGLRPDVLIGHSVGELVAAALAGIFSLPEAAGVLLDRVHRIDAAPPGGMLAVAASVDALGPYVSETVSIAAINAPKQTILAGPDEELERISAELRSTGRTCRRVPALSAFHSPVLAAAARGSVEHLAALTPRSPRIPVVSCYTTHPLDDATIADPVFWADQPVAPVRFWPALDRLIASHDRVVCVETGPGQGLAQIARRHPAMRAGRGSVIAVSPARPGPEDRDRGTTAAARAALAGLIRPSAPRPSRDLPLPAS
ncbi:acyltransferase domain-containing protein [Nocardia sp. CDC159]|uniref:Acyltransferase domain-containing protein n=1 Tax=Nocardia pulmonis TaxID=2951408 RepID=A0A9X2EI75_9NOCA|nr:MULTISPECIES: acyltransferase domain-containing protein [Nocardia]MCM6778693.1 acyltransferase domain-containing protein [Nocardia pulmonis]MCM6791582.1 acyltransferase domain-containing protein [Nocardia sp. CDC159]